MIFVIIQLFRISDIVHQAAFLIILFVAWRSHVNNRRGLWIILSGALGIMGWLDYFFIPAMYLTTLLGYIIVITTSTAGKRYVGTFFAVMGIYAANGMFPSRLP
jgi:hypothetical protein